MRRRATSRTRGAGFGRITTLLAPFLLAGSLPLDAEKPPTPPTTAEVLEAARADDWRRPDPSRLLVLDLEVPAGPARVVLEVAPEFAPEHVANLRRLVAQKYFDGLSVLRSQDNYVAQWGDPNAGEDGARSLGDAKEKLAPEWGRSTEGAPPFFAYPDGDVYAPEAGASAGFPAARDPETGRIWLVHCYGMVGAGRAEEPDSGNASQLYAVTGHSPRHLDHNVTLVGRVLDGIEALSTLPRGTGSLGFYEDPQPRPRIVRAAFASDLGVGERPALEVLRTDTETFAAWVESRRTRREPWFREEVGRIEVCNAMPPVRRSETPEGAEEEPSDETGRDGGPVEDVSDDG